MISEQDVAFRGANGPLVVADVPGAADVGALGRAAGDVVDDARNRTTHGAIYDLEDSHSPAEPRVRRIETPQRWHWSFARVAAHPEPILDQRDGDSTAAV